MMGVGMEVRWAVLRVSFSWLLFLMGCRWFVVVGGLLRLFLGVRRLVGLARRWKVWLGLVWRSARVISQNLFWRLQCLGELD